MAFKGKYQGWAALAMKLILRGRGDVNSYKLLAYITKFLYLARFLQVVKKTFQTAPLKMCFGEKSQFSFNILTNIWLKPHKWKEKERKEAHLLLRNERTGSTRWEQWARLKQTEKAEISIRKEQQKDSSCLPPERTGWKREARSAVEKQGGATGEGWEWRKGQSTEK